MGLRELGAGCPTGPAMPPGRGLGLGGTCAPSHAPSLQRMLSLCGQSHGSRGYFAGGVPAGVSYAGELPFGAWGICDVGNECDAELADRPLPAHEARSFDGFARRCHAGGGEQRIVGAAARPTSVARRIELAGAERVDAALTGVARSGDSAGPATTGVRGNSTDLGSTRRYGKVAHQSRTDRVGKDLAFDGSEAVMRTGAVREARGLVKAEWSLGAEL